MLFDLGAFHLPMSLSGGDPTVSGDRPVCPDHPELESRKEDPPP